MTGVLVGTADGLVGVGGNARPGLEGDVTALVRGAGALWALTGGRSVWRSADGDWERIAEVPGDLTGNCLLALDDETLYVGASEARLLRLEAGTLARVAGFDRVEGRDEWHTPWGGPPDVRSLSADAAGVVYANVHVGGIVWSADDGETWHPSGLDIHADVHQVLADPRTPRLLLAATAYGLAVSEDAGDTWETRADGLHATYCRAVGITDQGWLVSASRGHTGRDASLYLHRRGVLTRLTEGLPDAFADNLDTYRIAAEGRDAAIGTADGRVFRSNDSGWHWEQAADGLGTVTCVLLGRPAR